MTSSRQLSVATAGSVAAGLVGQGALVVAGPLVARMLGLDGRGHLAALVLWPAVIAQVGNLGVPLAVTQFTAEGRVPARRLARAAMSLAAPQALVLTAIHAVVLVLVLRGEPLSVRAAGAVTLAAVPAALAQRYGLAMLQGRQCFAAFNVLRTLPVVVYAAGVAVVFALGVTTIVPVVLVLTVSNAAGGLITLATGLRAAGTAAAGSGLANRSEMIRFGLRGLLGSVSPVETFHLDQMVLALFMAPAALGLYVVGLAFTNFPRFLAQSVGVVAYPSVAARADTAAARRTMWAFFWAGTAISIAVVVPLLFAAGWLVPFFFGNGFRDAVSVTQILLPGMVFAGARRVLADGLRGRGHPTAGTLAEVAAWVWLAPALAMLVPLWGANGVALALSTSYAVSFGVLLAHAAVLGEMGWHHVFMLPPREASSRRRLLPTPRWS